MICSEESSAIEYYKIVKKKYGHCRTLEKKITVLHKYGLVPVFLEQNSGISRERAKHEENAGYDPG